MTLNRHIQTCSLIQKEVFVSKDNSIWYKKPNIVKQYLDALKMNSVDFKYDYLVTFDLESILLKTNDFVGNKLNYISRHVAVSCSIATNIPGYKKQKFILSYSPQELCKQLFEYFDILAKTASELMNAKLKPVIDKVKNEKDKQLIIDYCSSLPILGFNSGFYDIGLLAHEGFIHEIVKRDSTPLIIKDGNRYKVIKTKTFTFLDQMAYCAAGTSLDKFIKAYDIEENKGYFPYEWFDSYDKLNYLVKDLKYEDFYSSLKGNNIKKEEFNELMEYCSSNNIIYIAELLEWYNNLDVVPMLKACLKQKEFFYTFGLDMYKDGFSLPGLSENIMYQFSINDFQEYLKKPIPELPTTIPKISRLVIKRRIYSYYDQDTIAKRSVDNLITIDEVKELFHKFNYRCNYCWKEIKSNTWSLDRIDNELSHTKDNCILSCIECNKQRSYELYELFYRKKALKRFSKDTPMIELITEKNKDVFEKLKQNMCGGLSLVFHRYHEQNKTKICRSVYENNQWKIGEEGKTVKKIVGFDANALYLWCLGQEMPCGKLKYTETNDMKYISDPDFFGFLEVDIHVPEHLYNYFSEFPPIVKNQEYSEEICGNYIKTLSERLWGKM